MKRNFLLALALLVSLSVFSACGSAPDTSDNSTVATVTPTGGDSAKTDSGSQQDPKTPIDWKASGWTFSSVLDVDSSQFIADMLKKAIEMKGSVIFHDCHTQPFPFPVNNDGENIQVKEISCKENYFINLDLNVRWEFKDYAYDKEEGLKVNGTLGIDYVYTQSHQVTFLHPESSSLSLLGKVYDFHSVEIQIHDDGDISCSGQVQIDEKSCTVSSDCKACQ